MLTVPFKKVTKFSGVHLLYLSIVWSFDYVYYPWLAIRFHYLLILPLFPSIFLVSWGGYYLYEYFREDVFFIERINTWLKEASPQGVRGRLKRAILRRPGYVYAVIATWWSPLHAYIFFRKEKTRGSFPLVKSLATGSLLSTLFWGVVAECVLLLWGLARAVALHHHWWI
jgi:hypothetical protein